jgi:dTDP-glucose 4,6-dehydratase
MLVLEKGKSGESYNISASNEIDNVTIVKSILTLLEKPENRLQFGEKRPGEDLRYSLNSSKIRKELDWKPKINFDEGLEKTIEWYMSNDDWWKNISQETFSSTPWKSNN